MPVDKYHERIIAMGRETNSRLVLPENSDNRIQIAVTELHNLGFQVVYNQDFQDNMDIYIDGLPPNMPSEGLENLFHTYGRVLDATVIKNTKAANCNGLVKMPNEQEAMHAISGLNGQILDGYKIRVRSSSMNPVHLQKSKRKK